jgi:predicted DCC family thiol-disulfide oxidoreductase YuxK
METQYNRLIYDKDCPFCNWYTDLFIRTGFLSKDGRIPYNEAVNDHHLHFNHIEARNKIALINISTGEVKYGTDSLLAVLGTKSPFIQKVGMFPPIHWLINQLYSFISFNRKVIAPSDCSGSCNCVPTTSYFWRWFFIAICALTVNNITAIYFNQHLNKYYTGIKNSDLIFFGLQLVIQSIVFISLKQKNLYDYLGQVSFVSFLGALLLFFFHIGLHWLHQTGINIDLLQPFCFGVVVTFMFFEHKRRVRLLHLSQVLSITWILFRIGIAPFAFNLIAL